MEYNNNTDNILKETSNILGILSKYDALKIFLHSIEGIEAETDAADKLGLTKKQYYTRLKQLVDSGLIEKRQDKYVHTTLGKVIYEKAIRVLFDHVKNSKKLLMIDVLKSSGKFDIDEIYKLLKTEDIYYNARLITDYDEFVRTVMSRLDGVDIKSIYYATRRLEDDIIRKILSKGTDIKLLIDIPLVKELSINEELKDKIKAVNIPFTIVLFNNNNNSSSSEVFIELVNSNDPSRSYAFINIKDDPLVDKVKAWLDNLADSAGGGI